MSSAHRRTFRLLHCVWLAAGEEVVVEVEVLLLMLRQLVDQGPRQPAQGAGRADAGAVGEQGGVLVGR
jgi:hypothetical protein